MYYVYVIQSKRDRHFYTGFTRDLKARIIEHNAGRVPSTKAGDGRRYVAQ
ncbi:MAG: GIY-YIG nuclease family protein [Syntrophaceae bacterium]|nr:GIY-YIG nuclease family protein [Syntrophaceae bacterium]